MPNWGDIINQFQLSGVTACFTVLAGVLVFVIGQWTVKFFIEPIQSQAQILGEIAFSLTFYANVEGVSGLTKKEYVKEVSSIIRKQASQLRASTWTIKWYWLWQLLGVVPKRKNIMKASSEMIGWSNSLFHDGVSDHIKSIQKLLGFKDV